MAMVGVYKLKSFFALVVSLGFHHQNSHFACKILYNSVTANYLIFFLLLK